MATSSPVSSSEREAEPDATCTGPPDRHEAVLAGIRSRLLAAVYVEWAVEVFKVLGDPTRVRLLDALTLGERCVRDLAALVGLTESAVSHQLRLLRGAHLVRVRRAGRSAFYRLDDHHVIGLLRDACKHVEGYK
jgi:DNA-binding transcriptional ArsR family regulator